MIQLKHVITLSKQNEGILMASKIFEALERRIVELGTSTKDSADLSELSLVGKGEERVIAFNLLGAAFLLTPENEIVSLDGEEGSTNTYAVTGDMKQSMLKFLGWRHGFIVEYGV